METAAAQQKWLKELTEDMRRQSALQRDSIERVWSRPLGERVESGDALGPLEVRAVSGKRVLLESTANSAETAAYGAREGDFVRLSRNDPQRPAGHGIFLGEDQDGIHLELRKPPDFAAPSEGWTLDPDFIDLTDRFLMAIDALARTALGRERILPLLMGKVNPDLDGGRFGDVLDELEAAGPESPWHESQQEAIASCLAAREAFLVQGPPGTGKTRVLAEVARRLIDRGERLLVTGPTHRAIANALVAIRGSVPHLVRVAKIGPPVLGVEGIECHDSYAESGLLDCGEPHVLGATPHALWNGYSWLLEAHFDTVLLDEASQLTPLLAAMGCCAASAGFSLATTANCRRWSCLPAASPPAVRLFPAQTLRCRRDAGGNLAPEQAARRMAVRYLLPQPLDLPARPAAGSFAAAG